MALTCLIIATKQGSKSGTSEESDMTQCIDNLINMHLRRIIVNTPCSDVLYGIAIVGFRMAVLSLDRCGQVKPLHKVENFLAPGAKSTWISVRSLVDATASQTKPLLDSNYEEDPIYERSIYDEPFGSDGDVVCPTDTFEDLFGTEIEDCINEINEQLRLRHRHPNTDRLPPHPVSKNARRIQRIVTDDFGTASNNKKDGSNRNAPTKQRRVHQRMALPEISTSVSQQVEQSEVSPEASRFSTPLSSIGRHTKAMQAGESSSWSATAKLQSAFPIAAVPFAASLEVTCGVFSTMFLDKYLWNHATRTLYWLDVCYM